MSRLTALFHNPWPLIGVVHLKALPGSPNHRHSMAELADAASADLEVLARTGYDGVVVENFGDHPFMPDRVDPITVAAMTQLISRLMDIARRVNPSHTMSFGVNVLRNDAQAALSIAAVTGARFIRVNVHCGAMVTDQGILQGKAHETLRLRRSLGSEVQIFADVLVKHAHPLGPVELESVARDTFLRGDAAALVLSGKGTGQATDLEQAHRLRKALPHAPLLIGSGLTEQKLGETMEATDGAIVGTALKFEGDVEAPIDEYRALTLLEARDAWLRELAARQKRGS